MNARRSRAREFTWSVIERNKAFSRTRPLRDLLTVTHGLGRVKPGVLGSARRGRRGLETPSEQVLTYFRTAHSPLQLRVPHTGCTQGSILVPSTCKHLVLPECDGCVLTQYLQVGASSLQTDHANKCSATSSSVWLHEAFVQPC
jgi:hypothetical protein